MVLFVRIKRDLPVCLNAENQTRSDKDGGQRRTHLQKVDFLVVSVPSRDNVRSGLGVQGIVLCDEMHL